ncbi:DWNN-domain-containing protein [Amniculicola lignicola CBS 123094]|uniref:DWNN-domain-containing protein n=1 Tax=Amniculicola lignicola CBS 123094 TaxID=1392246 RepID=A0A6A5WF25_9PLEO|nr:DWNN-domain-containing protein [Amniculicola lignicola CBS 123094]
MSSSVFYKFKNSREPERIVFDGTGISVFELKREIIAASGLGDGSDFDLHLYPEDQPTSEYDDDTTVISRSSTVIAVRRPAARGHGRAARYVSGRAPVRAIKKADPKAAISAPSGGIQSEQDAEAAFLAESAQVWDQQKESLSHARPVFHKKKPLNIPTHDPPPGYVCYRCQKKGHWIQACPTNDDPDFKPAARAKRTTGIPRSFLKTVEKPADGDLEGASGIMLNADGEYVQVMTDTKTWEKFQEKANASKAQAANADAANKEVRERGLECPIDKCMFVDPVKTPCCGKTYCHDCIENALADGDLVCPNCSKEEVLMDDLVSDSDMVEKIREYEADKLKEKAVKEQQAEDEQTAQTQKQGSPSPSSNNEKQNLVVPLQPQSTPLGGNGSDTDTSSASKKRKASLDIKPPSAPKAMRLQKEQEKIKSQNQNQNVVESFIGDMEALKNLPLMPPAGPAMGPAMGGMGGYGNMPYGGNMNGGFNNMNYPNAGGNMNGYSQQQQQNNMGGAYGRGAGGNWNQGVQNQNQGYGNGNQGMGGVFPNQNGNQNQNQNMGDKDAYERKPLNPHRSQNRARKQRAPDFHYV